MDTKKAPVTTARKKAAPAQRKTTPSKTPARTYAQLRKAFLDRAQVWMRGRPNREVALPDELGALVAAVGVPCRCGRTLQKLRDTDHTVWWQRAEGGHWADGVNVDCRASKA